MIIENFKFVNSVSSTLLYYRSRYSSMIGNIYTPLIDGSKKSDIMRVHNQLNGYYRVWNSRWKLGTTARSFHGNDDNVSIEWEKTENSIRV